MKTKFGAAMARVMLPIGYPCASDCRTGRLAAYLIAGHALPSLPLLSAAFREGRLGIDKVLELCRFADADSEAKLLPWAETVNTATIRRRADLWLRDAESERDAHADRFLRHWSTDEGRRIGFEAELPAAQGMVLVQALDRVAARIPAMPGEEDDYFMDARRADALVALASARLAADSDPDRATVVVHVDLEALRDATYGAEIEDGPVIGAETARRLLCNARTQTIVEEPDGRVAYVGRMGRRPAPWMLRQVRHRDKGCVFPGGARRFTEAHHIRFWRHGGKTELGNLALICSFHHRLVHEDGWSMERGADQLVRWRRRSGESYSPRPHSPPRDTS